MIVTFEVSDVWFRPENDKGDGPDGVTLRAISPGVEGTLTFSGYGMWDALGIETLESPKAFILTPALTTEQEPQE